MTVSQGIMFALHASLMPELFGTSVRYSGVSLGFQVGGAVSGGFTPLIATALVHASGGDTWPVSLYILGLTAISIMAIGYARPMLYEQSEKLQTTATKNERETVA